MFTNKQKRKEIVKCGKSKKNCEVKKFEAGVSIILSKMAVGKNEKR